MQDQPSPSHRLILEQSGVYEDDPTSWWCWFRNTESMPVTIRVSVTCLKPAP